MGLLLHWRRIMQTTADFVSALREIHVRAGETVEMAEANLEKRVIGWGRIHGQAAELRMYVGMSLAEYAGDNPVEDRPLTDGERGLYRATEEWWGHVQELVNERRELEPDTAQ
jgi:hypothetical protein